MKLIQLPTAVLAGVLSAPVLAADYSVTVTNLTRGIYFTPLLVSAHPADMSLFNPGAEASPALQAMAEGGDISGLSSALSDGGAIIVENPAGGLLGPAQSTEVMINNDDAPDNTNLSIVAMMLPTNDGFVGMPAVALPMDQGTYHYNVLGYDAGTEANNEIRGSGAPGEAGFPAPGPVDTASGTNGTGINAEVEGFVHVHRNVLGDTDAAGGASDIDSTVHRWLNPVARVTITVN